MDAFAAHLVLENSSQCLEVLSSKLHFEGAGHMLLLFETGYT